MGNCSCISKSGRDDFEELSIQKPKIDPNTSYKKIVKIQSNYRGYLARKKLYEIKLEHYNSKVIENLRKFAATYLASKFKKMKPYVYNLETDTEDQYFERRIFKPAQQFLEGGTYIGEW